MKKILTRVLFALAIVLCQLPYHAWAQQDVTPNISLIKPQAEPGTWGADINSDLDKIDSMFPGGATGHRIREEGADLAPRSNLNFKGAGVTATDNSATDSTDVEISITGAGHTILNQGGAGLTQRPALNFTGAGVTCTDNSGANQTDCTIPSGSVDVAAAFVWTGAHSWRSGNWSLFDSATPSKILKWDISGFTASTTRTWSGPDASTRLIGDSDFSATGLMARTTPYTYAGRTLTAADTGLTITNGNGAAGNPTFALGVLAVKTNASNTWSTGDQDFGAASSFKFPVAAGATPTVSGRCAYDSTANRMKCGFNGSTVTLAITSEMQALNANLTALAGLTGVNNTIPVFTGAGALVTAALPTCLDSAGQHLNYDTATRSWSCGTSSTGGLAGGTTNKFLIATSGTTYDATTSNLTQAAGVINASGGFTVGDVSTNYISFDPSAVTGAKAWTLQNIAGIPLVATTEGGAITDTQMAIFKTTGGITRIVNGGAAGTGTWTDSSTNTGTNKTLVATDAGGTNTITTGVKAYFDAASLTPDVAGKCALQTAAAINSGPILPFMTCADDNASTFDGHFTLPTAVTTLDFRITVNDVDSLAQHFAGGFKAMCRASGAVVNATWGTSVPVDITMTTANTDYAQSVTVTPNSTCGANAELFWRFTIDAATNTDDGDARIIGVLIKQVS